MGKQSQRPPWCRWLGHPPLLPSLRGILPSSFASIRSHLGILYLRTCVGLGYGRTVCGLPVPGFPVVDGTLLIDLPSRAGLRDRVDPQSFAVAGEPSRIRCDRLNGHTLLMPTWSPPSSPAHPDEPSVPRGARLLPPERPRVSALRLGPLIFGAHSLGP